VFEIHGVRDYDRWARDEKRWDVLPAGGSDPQKPHQQDEFYYLVSGRACMKVAGEDREVKAGSVIFAAADEEHQLYDIKEELVVRVLFRPAESS
jgi:mannose-6-phosphate isomerase-like protein (cupin superfamily)